MTNIIKGDFTKRLPTTYISFVRTDPIDLVKTIAKLKAEPGGYESLKGVMTANEYLALMHPYTGGFNPDF